MAFAADDTSRAANGDGAPRSRFPDRIHVITEAAQSPPPSQVDAEAAIATLFPDSARITLGLVFVPDPRVPRHRRAFDIAIGALSSGMLDADYVLDRFSLPWAHAAPVADDTPDDRPAELVDDGRFGLMVFRHDCWRETQPPCRGAARRVVAMYLVPETVSYGAPRKTLQHALGCMLEQASPPGLKTRDAAASRCRTERSTGSKPEDRAPGPGAKVDLLRSPELAGCGGLVMIGPDFSGSVDSIARTLATTLARPDPAAGVCLLSVSATASSNAKIEGYDQFASEPAAAFDLRYYSLAVADHAKLSALTDLASQLGVAHDADTGRFSMALLCEESVFGSGLCLEGRRYAEVLMSFPSNIADIRFHRREAERKAAGNSPVDVSALDTNLHLDEGAENGSEFPDSQQSPLTAASSELKLDKMLSVLARQEPQIIAVAATDVRDRLFLFDQLRSEVPDAVLVDLEADVLLTHPDFLHASRGIVMLASHQLYTDRRETEANIAGYKPWRSYATDYEALAIKAVSRLVLGQSPLVGTAPPSDDAGATEDLRRPCVLVAARGGPRRAYIWGRTVSDDGICRMKQPAPDQAIGSWEWRERWGGIGALLLAVVLVTWLCRQRVQWVSNAWTKSSFAAEFLLLPAVAVALVFISLPNMPHSYQWLRSALVVCAMLAPLLAIHRAAVRAFASDAAPDRRWLARIADLWEICKSKDVAFTMKVILFVPASINVVFLAAALFTWIAAGKSVPTGAARDWLRLAMDTNSGFALLPALGIAFVATLFGLAFMVLSLHHCWRNDQVMKTVGTVLKHPVGRREIGKAVLLILYTALAYAVAKSLPLARTIFGRPAAVATCLAEVALCAQASMFVLCAMSAAGRAETFARTLFWSLVRSVQSGRTAERRWKAFWSAWSGPVFLSKTPFSASLQPVIEIERTLPPERRVLFCGAAAQAQQIAAWIKGNHAEEAPFGVWAIYRLLVSEVSSMRWSVFGALFSCLALVLVVYEFPAPGADNFLLLGLVLMLLAGLITAYSVISLERSKWISRVLCNTSERVEFSWTYFAYLLAPVLLLAIAIAIVELPGVLVWGNGVMSLLRYIGLLH